MPSKLEREGKERGTDQEKRRERGVSSCHTSSPAPARSAAAPPSAGLPNSGQACGQASGNSVVERRNGEKDGKYGCYVASKFQVIADRNYAVGEQALVWIDMPEQDPLYKKKIDIWQKHQTPKSEHICSPGCTKTSFAIKEVKYSGDKGIGIPQILRAFVRVFYATSTEELEEMAMEAAENDGRLARRPLKHAEREVHAHRKLLLHLDNMIQGHSTAIEQLEIVDGTASRNMHPFRKEMAKDILAGELQVLQSAHAWAANYCETVNMS